MNAHYRWLLSIYTNCVCNQHQCRSYFRFLISSQIRSCFSFAPQIHPKTTLLLYFPSTQPHWAKIAIRCSEKRFEANWMSALGVRLCVWMFIVRNTICFSKSCFSSLQCILSSPRYTSWTQLAVSIQGSNAWVSSHQPCRYSISILWTGEVGTRALAHDRMLCYWFCKQTSVELNWFYDYRRAFGSSTIFFLFFLSILSSDLVIVWKSTGLAKSKPSIVKHKYNKWKLRKNKMKNLC